MSPHIETKTSVQDRPTRGRNGRIAAIAILAVVLLGGVIGGLATQAFAGGPFGWGSPSSMHGDGDGPMDPAQLDKFVERLVKHFSVDIDATADQQAKLVAIAQGAAKDMLGMRQEMRRARQQAVDILTAPTIDRAALEQLRAGQVQKLDEASKRGAQALADAAEVLSPEQRQEAAKRMEAFHERRWFRPRG